MKYLRLFAIVPMVFACGGLEPELAIETSEAAICAYPMTTTFGTADAFDPMVADPIPYNPAYPQFVAYLNSLGITDLKTFDDFSPNHHMVATLRHGLASCFPGAASLELCFRARAHFDAPSDDRLAIYDTDFTGGTFPVVASMAIVPALSATWNIGQVGGWCIDLTPQMVGGLIGDMLQFRLADDTAVDVITMTLN